VPIRNASYNSSMQCGRVVVLKNPPPRETAANSANAFHLFDIKALPRSHSSHFLTRSFTLPPRLSLPPPPTPSTMSTIAAMNVVARATFGGAKGAPKNKVTTGKLFPLF